MKREAHHPGIGFSAFAERSRGLDHFTPGRCMYGSTPRGWLYLSMLLSRHCTNNLAIMIPVHYGKSPHARLETPLSAPFKTYKNQLLNHTNITLCH